MVLLGGSSEKERKRKWKWKSDWRGICNKKQGNNAVKMDSFNKTKGTANTNM